MLKTVWKSILNSFFYNMEKRFCKYLIIIVTVFLTVSCATYHDLSVDYQRQIQQENYKTAQHKIENNKFLKKKRNMLLNYVEQGKLAHLQKDYELSNVFFNKADLFLEDFKKDFGRQLLGVLTNPEKENYKGEDFEKVAIHYYKSLNYIFLNQFDEALVEARRINLQLQNINDTYPKGKKNRYKSDAFALNLQGLLYEAVGDLNDAFIAYRNAVELYLKNDGTYFGVAIPRQLKQDVINTAHQLGFKNEEEYFSELFQMRYNAEQANKKSLVVFWENGLVPYKSQTYFTFTELPGNNNGFVTITNDDLGLDIPIPSSKKRRDNNSDFSDLSVLNIAFPKYEERRSLFTKAELISNGVVADAVPLELIEDYSVIAQQTLKDRTFREIGKIAIRIATKKLAESVVTEQNANLGALVGLFNAFTEKTDTRNWQTLPSQIFYARIPISKDQKTVTLKISNPQGEVLKKELQISSKNHINFLNYNSHQIIESN